MLRAERAGLADAHQLDRRKKLEEELTEARKREQARREEEKKRAAERPIVVRGLDKILGRGDGSPNQADSSGDDDEDADVPSAAAPTAEAVSAPSVPEAALPEHIVDAEKNLRVWLEEPPGLRKPPYMPAFSGQRPPGVRSEADIPLLVPSSLSAYPPPPGSPLPPPPPPPSRLAEPSAERIPWPSARPYPPPPPPPPSAQSPYQAVHHPRAPRPAPYPVYSASSSPPEIDPMDPNPDTALDRWKKEQTRGSGGGYGRGRGANAGAPSSAAPPQPPPAPVRRALPRPAFVPTNLLVKNRPVAVGPAPFPANVSRPVAKSVRAHASQLAIASPARALAHRCSLLDVCLSASVNAAPAVSSAPTVSLPSKPVVRSKTELEYDALMRSLEADGAL